MSSKTAGGKVATYNESLVAEVESVAATDEAVKKALAIAVDAGKVAGATIHGTEALAQFKALGDMLAKAIAEARAEEAVTATEGSKQFRLLVGMANAAIRAAQTTAKRLAIGQHKAAELSTYAKKARDKIVKCLDRHLAIYGYSVDWQAVTFAEVAVPDEVTEEQRAAKAVVSAFNLSGAGALQGVLQLPSQTLVALAAAVQAELGRQAKAAAEAKVADKRNEAARVIEMVRALKQQPQPDHAAIKQGTATARAIANEWRTARRTLQAMAA